MLKSCIATRNATPLFSFFMVGTMMKLPKGCTTKIVKLSSMQIVKHDTHPTFSYGIKLDLVEVSILKSHSYTGRTCICVLGIPRRL